MKNLLIPLYFLISLSCLPAGATSVLPLSLEQLSTRATLIFYGEVISNQTRKDEQSEYIATFTEFKIIDLIKGDTGTTHTIKQIGGYDPESKTKLFIQGVPSFQLGDKCVVFLPEESSLGFSSPLGLHQGNYPVSTVDGEELINNGRNLNKTSSTNGEQVRTLITSTKRPTKSRLVDFTNTIRTYNAR